MDRSLMTVAGDRRVRRALAGFVAAAALLVAVAAAKGTNPNQGACDGPPGKVDVAFDISHARDLWAHIPGFLSAPELEIDKPAHVVVYSGKVTLAVGGGSLGGGAKAAVVNRDYDGVVCVAIDGVPTFYSSVDLSVVRP